MSSVDIITTASLPWFTGTSINPLIRASYLKSAGYDVTLHCPYVPLTQQHHIFSSEFLTPDQQVPFMRNFLEQKKLQSDFAVKMYPARYIKQFGSIFPRCALQDRVQAKTLILEDPLVLTYRQQFQRQRFNKSLGIVHTNYQRCIGYHVPFFLNGLSDSLLKVRYGWIARQCVTDLVQLNTLMCAPFIKTALLMGVADPFFQSVTPTSKGCYYIGKVVWDKGFKSLIDGLSGSAYPSIDVYGSGKDADTIQRYARKKDVECHFKGVVSDAYNVAKHYRVLINPSRTDMFGTVTAEALAMQQHVLIPDTQQSEYFAQFKNCFRYSNFASFRAGLTTAMTRLPVEDRSVRQMDWSAATERLLHYL